MSLGSHFIRIDQYKEALTGFQPLLLLRILLNQQDLRHWNTNAIRVDDGMRVLFEKVV
jgi:hypothetical protein